MPLTTAFLSISKITKRELKVYEAVKEELEGGGGKDMA